MHIVCYKVNRIKLTSINGITLTSTIEITLISINGITLTSMKEITLMSINGITLTSMKEITWNYQILVVKYVNCLKNTLLINTC